MKDIKYLIIPDVHGREFWKAPVDYTLQSTDAHLVFLGDYHDPYPYEFQDDPVDHSGILCFLFPHL